MNEHIDRPVSMSQGDIDGDRSTITLTPYTIENNLTHPEFVYITDIDSDPDVVATGYSLNKVVWYENVGGMPISWTKHTIEITSLNGQLFYSTKMEGTIHHLDLSSCQKGVYFITIRSNDFVTTEKIIKLRFLS